MGKKRVHEYAKEHDMSSKRVIEKAKELGIELGNHMSTIDENQVQKLNQVFTKKEAGTKVAANTKNQTVHTQVDKGVTLRTLKKIIRSVQLKVVDKMQVNQLKQGSQHKIKQQILVQLLNLAKDNQIIQIVQLLKQVKDNQATQTVQRLKQVKDNQTTQIAQQLKLVKGNQVTLVVQRLKAKEQQVEIMLKEQIVEAAEDKAVIKVTVVDKAAIAVAIKAVITIAIISERKNVVVAKQNQ